MVVTDVAIISKVQHLNIDFTDQHERRTKKEDFRIWRIPSYTTQLKAYAQGELHPSVIMRMF